MADQHLLLDAFADVRRAWDDLVTLEPDIVSAGGALTLRERTPCERRRSVENTPNTFRKMSA